MSPADPSAAGPRRNRNRATLVVIAAIFLGSFALAGALRLSGWRPAITRNHGELLQPPADLRELAPRLADGGRYEWRPMDRTWRILVAPPADCAEPCVVLAGQLDTVWQLFGRQADHVHILWIGTPPAGAAGNTAWRVLRPDPAIVAALPGGDRANAPSAPGVAAYVVDPNGFVILRYPPGFDPGDLREDVARLLKLQ